MRITQHCSVLCIAMSLNLHSVWYNFITLWYTNYIVHVWTCRCHSGTACLFCTLPPAYDASHFLIFVGLPSSRSPMKRWTPSRDISQAFGVKKQPAGTWDLRPFPRNQHVTDYILLKPHLLTRSAKFMVGIGTAQCSVDQVGSNQCHLIRMKYHQIPRELQLKPPDYSMLNAYSVPYCLCMPMLMPCLGTSQPTISCKVHWKLCLSFTRWRYSIVRSSHTLNRDTIKLICSAELSLSFSVWRGVVLRRPWRVRHKPKFHLARLDSTRSTLSSSTDATCNLVMITVIHLLFNPSYSLIYWSVH